MFGCTFEMNQTCASSPCTCPKKFKLCREGYGIEETFQAEKIGTHAQTNNQGLLRKDDIISWTYQNMKLVQEEKEETKHVLSKLR